MNNTYLDIVFEGDKFLPSKLKERTGLPIESLAEYGKVATRGRYKGKASPYGLAVLKVGGTTSQDINKLLLSATRYLIAEKSALDESGVEEITLDLENLNLNDSEIKIDAEIMKLISELNASVDISSAKASNPTSDENNRVVYFYDSNIIPNIVSALYSNMSSIKGLSEHKEKKLRSLFSKLLESDYNKISLPIPELTSAISFYIIRYFEEEGDKVPPFEEVIRESQRCT